MDKIISTMISLSFYVLFISCNSIEINEVDNNKRVRNLIPPITSEPIKNGVYWVYSSRSIKNYNNKLAFIRYNPSAYIYKETDTFFIEKREDTIRLLISEFYITKDSVSYFVREKIGHNILSDETISKKEFKKLQFYCIGEDFGVFSNLD